MNNYTLSAAFVAAFGAGGSLGWLASDTDMATMAKEVDAYRSAEAKVLAEAGQFRETVPTELAKALLAAVPDKRLLNGEACKVVDGRVFCQVENGNEVQFPASKTALLQPEVDAIKAEWKAAVAAKAAALAAEEEAARLAAGAIEKP
jgi:hypothetical protein